MKRLFVNHIAGLMIAVFAFFYCGNTVFIHSHLVGGHKITHSHPFSKTTEHSQNTLELISCLNLSVLTFETAPEIAATENYCEFFETMGCAIVHFLYVGHKYITSLRAPPCVD